MSSWPIERKAERVVVVSIKANKANVITHGFMDQVWSLLFCFSGFFHIMTLKFSATLDRLESEYPADAVVLTGNGLFFSAGLDLKFMSSGLQEKRFAAVIDYVVSCRRLPSKLNVSFSMFAGKIRQLVCTNFFIPSAACCCY